MGGSTTRVRCALPWALYTTYMHNQVGIIGNGNAINANRKHMITPGLKQADRWYKSSFWTYSKWKRGLIYIGNMIQKVIFRGNHLFPKNRILVRFCKRIQVMSQNRKKIFASQTFWSAWKLSRFPKILFWSGYDDIELLVYIGFF